MKNPVPKSPASKPDATRRLFLPVAILALVVPAGGLVSRAWLARQASTNTVLMRLGDDVPLTKPARPSSPELKLEQFRSLHAPLQALRDSLPQMGKELDPLLVLAREAGLAGDHLTAREALGRAIRGGSKSEGILDAMGRTCLQLGLYGEVKSTYSRMVNLDPKNHRGFVGLTRALTGLGDNAGAMSALDKCKGSLAPEDTVGLLAVASELIDRGDLAGALSASMAAARVAPSEPEPAIVSARILFNLQRVDQAAELIAPIVKAHPKHVRARLLLGSILCSPINPQNDLALAEHHFLTAAEQEPGDIEPLQRLGMLYHEQDRYRQAAYIFLRILELSPDNTAARMRLGSALQKLGDTREAAKQREIGRDLVERDRREERLIIARNQDPSNPGRRLALGRFYLQDARYVRAFGEFQSAFALTGSHEARIELITLYRLAKLTPPDHLRRGVQ